MSDVVEQETLKLYTWHVYSYVKSYVCDVSEEYVEGVRIGSAAGDQGEQYYNCMYIITNPTPTADAGNGTSYFNFSSYSNGFFCNNVACCYVGCYFASDIFFCSAGDYLFATMPSCIFKADNWCVCIECTKNYYATFWIGTGTLYSVSSPYYTYTIGIEQYNDVYSTDLGKYPHDGYQDGYYYVLVTE